MMLTALYEYAQREGLLEDTDYEPRHIDVVVDLDEKGGLLAVVETDQIMAVPRHKHSVAVEPAFAVDNAKYALGIAGKGARPKDLKRASSDSRSFATLMASVAAQYPADVALRALDLFQRNIDAQRAQVLKDRPADHWTGNENVVFRVAGVFVHESPGARAGWAVRRQAGGGEAGTTRCLVTGCLAVPELTHPWIKRIPGTNKGQTALVSFNKPAFASMNLEQSQNAPVSRKGAEGYVTALNYLLRDDPSTERRYASGIGLGNENVVLVWTKENAPELSTLLDWFDGRAAESAVETVRAPFSGLEPSASDATDFYAVTLGGNAARVVVRDWYQTKFGEVKANIRRWFDDLRLVGQERPVALWQLLAAIDPPGNATVPPALATSLGRAALFGGRVPYEVLRHSLLRLRVPPKPQERHLLLQRIALVKLTLIRTFHQEVSVSLDEEKKEVPYLLGRLFAVLERLQGAALGDVNATIRDRYFGAASSTPAVVFPRLIRLSMHHAAKSGASWLERIKGQIMNALPAEQFPQLLSLEHQGLFAVGYYHQREKFFEKKQAVGTTQAEEAA